MNLIAALIFLIVFGKYIIWFIARCSYWLVMTVFIFLRYLFKNDATFTFPSFIGGEKHYKMFLTIILKLVSYIRQVQYNNREIPKTDTGISEEEYQKIFDKLLSKLLNPLTPKDRDSLKCLTEKLQEAQFSQEEEDFLYQYIAVKPKKRRTFFRILTLLIFTQGTITPELEQYLASIATNIRIPPKEFKDILISSFKEIWGYSLYKDTTIRSRSYNYKKQQERTEQKQERKYKQQKEESRNTHYDNPSSLANAYKILNVAESASLADIKRAYRRLIRKYHPDRHSDLDVNSKEYAELSQRAQEINAAYDTIVQARSER